MKSEIQIRIINILGSIAILTLGEVLLLQLILHENDLTLLNMMLMIPNSVISLLGGFLTGRAVTKLEQNQEQNNTIDEVINEYEDEEACKS